MELLDLDDDVLSLISSFCYRDEINALSETCKALYSLTTLRREEMKPKELTIKEMVRIKSFELMEKYFLEDISFDDNDNKNIIEEFLTAFPEMEYVEWFKERNSDYTFYITAAGRTGDIEFINLIRSMEHLFEPCGDDYYDLPTYCLLLGVAQSGNVALFAFLQPNEMDGDLMVDFTLRGIRSRKLEMVKYLGGNGYQNNGEYSSLVGECATVEIFTYLNEKLQLNLNYVAVYAFREKNYELLFHFLDNDNDVFIVEALSMTGSEPLWFVEMAIERKTKISHLIKFLLTAVCRNYQKSYDLLRPLVSDDDAIEVFDFSIRSVISGHCDVWTILRDNIVDITLNPIYGIRTTAKVDKHRSDQMPPNKILKLLKMSKEIGTPIVDAINLSNWDLMCLLDELPNTKV